MDEKLDNITKKSSAGASVWIYFVVFVVIFLVGVYWLYQWWLKPWMIGVENQQNNEIVIPGIDQTDSDGDGLSLKEESQLGTSDNMTDSDGDKLSDDEEIKLGTDPLNKDSDRDGYNDGLEVDTNHNPLK